jgi:hypothetical protein
MVIRVGLGLFVLGAAATAVLFAGVLNWLACLEETSEACGRQGLANVQLALAAVAAIPAFGLAASILFGRRRAALVLVIVGVVAYASWAVLADAAHHGWDDLKVVPFA